jgi:hypothetical protein
MFNLELVKWKENCRLWIIILWTDQEFCIFYNSEKLIVSNNIKIWNKTNIKLKSFNFILILFHILIVILILIYQIENNFRLKINFLSINRIFDILFYKVIIFYEYKWEICYYQYFWLPNTFTIIFTIREN